MSSANARKLQWTPEECVYPAPVRARQRKRTFMRIVKTVGEIISPCFTQQLQSISAVLPKVLSMTRVESL